MNVDLIDYIFYLGNGYQGKICQKSTFSIMFTAGVTAFLWEVIYRPGTDMWNSKYIIKKIVGRAFKVF